eukprot:gene15837-17433_t
MEFKFDINSLLPNEITIVDSKLCPFKNTRQHKDKSVDDLKRDLSNVIDAMGMASSKAQGLKGVITTGLKMVASNHHLYLLKDAHANNGKGAVVGLIKVGFKRLFLLDIHNQQLEVNPLCVLDFYVHESRQRTGCGLRLFKTMLEAEVIKPECMAYDRPSSKFLNFLRKHFDLQKVVNQMNNYTVFTEFFHNLPGYVPGNKRFISSAPIDSRLPSVQADRRQISSAGSSSSRSNLPQICGDNSANRYNGIKALETHGIKALETRNPATNRNATSNLISHLPPRPPAKNSRTINGTSWSRRNASNIPFARNDDSSEFSFLTSSPAYSHNAYSRHSYAQEQAKSNDRVSKESPITGIQARMKSPQSSTGSLSLGTIGLDKRQHTVVGITNESTTKQLTTGSLASQSREGNARRTGQPENSYSVDNMYKKTISIADSNVGTAWNIFGVSLGQRNSSASKQPEGNNNRRTFHT